MTQAIVKTEDKLGFIHPRSLEEAMKYAEIIAKKADWRLTTITKNQPVF